MTLSFTEWMPRAGEMLFFVAQAAGELPGAGDAGAAAVAEPHALVQVWQFLVAGGFFMIFIVACSFVALTVFIHRAMSLRRKSVIPQVIERELEHLERTVRVGDTARLGGALAHDDSALAEVARTALAGDYEDRAEAASAVEASAREEMVKLHTGLAVLEVVITIAPLLGLLGTVSGLVSVFGTIGSEQVDTSDPRQVARGIAEALNSTIAGLAVAIPTVIGHSYLNKKIERLAARMEVIMSDVLGVLYRSPGEEEEDLQVRLPPPGADGRAVSPGTPTQPPTQAHPERKPGVEPEREPERGPKQAQAPS